MKPMMYIRYLCQGDVGHDLANPFKTAYLTCPECGSSMILDRRKWTTVCLRCSFSELDIPSMLVNRSNVSREAACISFELCVSTVRNSDPSRIFIGAEGVYVSEDRSRQAAGGIKCTMKEVRRAHKDLINRPLLVEALCLLHDVSMNDIINKLIGARLDREVGFFLFPKIRLKSFVEEIEIISMLEPSVRHLKARGCNALH